jgi:DNA-nicking Smr family endonuclease
MNKRNDITPEDIELFREAIGPVSRLQSDRAEVPTARPDAVPEQSLLQTREILAESLYGNFDESELETGDELLHAQTGVTPNVLRKLRRGQYSLQARLDLHGMTVAIAKQALSDFLRDCQAAGYRCVIVIHGKGNGSLQRRPILKGKVNYWLQQRRDVLAFCSARTVDGGTGAVYVLLKKS